jgi:hypothetical protein
MTAGQAHRVREALQARPSAQQQRRHREVRESDSKRDILASIERQQREFRCGQTLRRSAFVAARMSEPGYDGPARTFFPHTRKARTPQARKPRIIKRFYGHARDRVKWGVLLGSLSARSESTVCQGAREAVRFDVAACAAAGS